MPTAHAPASPARRFRPWVGPVVAALLLGIAAALLLGPGLDGTGPATPARQVALLLCAACGMLAGFLSGLLGIGGALIVVPALYLLLPPLGVDDQRLAHVAVATSLASMLPSAAMAAWSQHRRGALATDWLARLAPVTLIGACLGGLLALHLRGHVLTMLFAAQSLYFGWGLMRGAAARADSSRARIGGLASRLPPGLAGLGSAALSTCAGMGGGILTVPYLVARGLPLLNAAATSSALNIGIASGGVLCFTLAAGTPLVHWRVAAVVGLCATVAVPCGVALAHRLPARVFRRTLGVVMLLSACVLTARVAYAEAAAQVPGRSTAIARLHGPVSARMHEHAPGQAHAHATGHMHAHALALAQMEFDFRRYALNALLVPLIDDDAPQPRWTTPHELLNCGPATEVRIDGRPLAPGTEVQPAAFSVSWQLDGCLPFGPDALELSGRVDLDVFRGDEGISAIVRPLGLRVMSPVSLVSAQTLSATFVDSIP